MASQGPPLSLRTVVQARRNQVSSALGDDLVILDLDSSLYYSLDPVGRRVFERLQEPTPLHAILDDVVAEFEVDAATAGPDLLSLVGELVAQSLVEVRPADEP